jgi:acyl carrier protein
MSMTEIRPLDQDASLRDKVRELVATTFLMDPDELPHDASQETCERWTSLYHMTLLVVLEEQFGVTLSMDEMTSMTSVPKIVDVLKSHGVTT